MATLKPTDLPERNVASTLACLTPPVSSKSLPKIRTFSGVKLLEKLNIDKLFYRLTFKKTGKSSAKTSEMSENDSVQHKIVRQESAPAIKTITSPVNDPKMSKSVTCNVVKDDKKFDRNDNVRHSNVSIETIARINKNMMDLKRFLPENLQPVAYFFLKTGKIQFFFKIVL